MSEHSCKRKDLGFSTKPEEVSSRNKGANVHLALTYAVGFVSRLNLTVWKIIKLFILKTCNGLRGNKKVLKKCNVKRIYKVQVHSLLPLVS